MNSPSHSQSRRQFYSNLGLTALGMAGAPVISAGAAESVPPVGKPKGPHRVWFQPRLFHRDMSLYAGMTMDASGWLDPKLAALTGRTSLSWAYGTNNPEAAGPDYWRDICVKETKSPGVALDEWVPSKNPAMEGWVAEGLRAGRKAAPETFIAVWVTDPTPTLAGLVKDGTVDLVIVETYTFAAASYGPDSFMAWASALRRMDAAQALGMGEKSIFCLGHISPDKDGKGKFLDMGELKERAHVIKERYPKAPGIAFYQDCSNDDSKAFRSVVRQCDELSTTLWPG